MQMWTIDTKKQIYFWQGLWDNWKNVQVLAAYIRVVFIGLMKKSAKCVGFCLLVFLIWLRKLPELENFVEEIGIVIQNFVWNPHLRGGG